MTTSKAVPAPERSLLRQTLHTLVFGAGAQIAGVVAGIVFARVYGPIGKGQISYALTFCLFAFAMSDGIRAATAQFVGSRGTPERAAWGSALVAIAAGSLLTVGALGIALLVHAPNPPLLAAAAAAVVATLAFHSAIGVFLVRHRVERTNRVLFWQSVGAAVAGSILALAAGAPPPIIVGVNAVALALGFVALAWRLRGELGGGPQFGAPGDSRAYLAFAARSMVASLVSSLALRVDVFVVAAFSATGLGLYTLALGSGEMMWQLSRAITGAALGRLAGGDLAQATALCARIVRTLLAVQGAIALVLFVAGPALIALVYGRAFAESGAVLRVVLPGLVAYSADSVLATFVAVKEGAPEAVVRVNALEIAVCVGLALALIHPYGIVGVAAANSVAYLTAFALRLAHVARRQSVSVWAFLIPQRADIAAVGELVRSRFGGRA